MDSKIIKKKLSNMYVKSFSLFELNNLAKELRRIILKIVSKNGGHLSSNLGTIELTLALHHVFSPPNDKIIWDVGHQSYCHKIITGRQIKFKTLRKINGISGFTKRSESIYDSFTAGHSSTSISSGLGVAYAKQLKKEKSKIISVIGDGSLTSGLAYEGLNQIINLNENKNFILILNDNKMSISKSVGALPLLLDKTSIKKKQKFLTKSNCKSNKSIYKKKIVANIFFKTFNLKYFGPIDGHNIKELVDIFKNIKKAKRPVILHILTKKGKGYKPAEENPTYFHGINPFDISTGVREKNKRINFTKVFGNTLNELANKNNKIIAITAAMPNGTGLEIFKKSHPERFFDVGIAEQHSVTFAAGMSTEGYIPIVAIYSTFLQRSYDQILHDVCIEKLHVIFAIDRSGIVGEDGVTHHGLFDLSYLRSIPNMVIMAPKDENELRNMLYTAISYNGPISFRFPKDKIMGITIDTKMSKIEIGKGEILSVGGKAVFLAIGNAVNEANLAAKYLKKIYNVSVTVVNARFIKPLDKKLLIGICNKFKIVLTIEENILNGGFGSAVLELLAEHNIKIDIFKRIGIKNVFVEHGSQKKLRSKYFVDFKFIIKTVLSSLKSSKKIAKIKKQNQL